MLIGSLLGDHRMFNDVNYYDQQNILISILCGDRASSTICLSSFLSSLFLEKLPFIIHFKDDRDFTDQLDQVSDAKTKIQQ